MKTYGFIATLITLMVGTPFSSMADTDTNAIPLFYAVENTGTNFPAPPLPTLGNLPVIQPLPDPFKWANGSGRSTNFADWSHRRAEIKAQIENYEIGLKPAVDPAMVSASFTSNSPTSGTLNVTITNVVAGTNRTLTLTCAISLPAGAGPFPAIIGMNSPNGSVNSSLLTSRNIARITFSHNQVTTYGNPQNTDPYYQLYPNLNINNTGQYSAWAWGVSRIIDGLYRVQGTLPIDVSHLAVTGCSYAGKMALFSGAFDERIALTIAQESGGGGAPSWRYSATETAGTVEGLAQTDHNWFSEGMFAFGGANVSRLPHDHHELMAMVAPRALFATGNPDFTWLSNPSCYVSCRAVEQIYKTWGIGDRFGYNIIGGHNHCATTAGIDAEMGAFLDKFMLGNTNVNTKITTYPDNYASIDYARWFAWWGTATPVFRNTSVSLSIPAAATEGDGALAGQGSLTVSPIPPADLTVNLTSSDPTEVTVPATVVIPAGQTNAVFDLNIIDDSLLDGDQTANITATVFSFTTPQAKITVHDNETAALSVTLPASASESAGTLANAGSVSIGTAAGANVTVSLNSSDSSKLILPPTIVIPTGQTSAVFNLTFVNNNVSEAPQTVTVTAHVPNWTDGSASLTVLDDELPDHFAWSAIPSPQMIGEPFPVTIAAQDIANHTVDYGSLVMLSALIVGNATGTNTILNSPSAEQSFTENYEYSLGYSFTPGTNLKVTHVRHYFGDKVSIWTDSGRLLTSQNVVSVPGIWVDTPLPAPLILAAGDTYRMAIHEKGGQYFWSQNLPATFSDGIINQSFWDSGDVFPIQEDGTHWFFVDLRYATDFASVPVTPVATTDFSNGVWSGSLAVLQAATNVMLQASAGAGHSGVSVLFNVLGTPKLTIAAFSNSIVLSWPTAASGFNLEQAATLSNWTNAPGTPVIVGNRYNVTNAIEAAPSYYRLRKP